MYASKPEDTANATEHYLKETSLYVKYLLDRLIAESKTAGNTKNFMNFMVR
jgi:hypothetical protein